MPTQTVRMREVFPLGLREQEDDPANLGMADLYGVKPSRRGYVPVEAPNYPVGGGVAQDVAHPLPMLLKGTQGNYLLKIDTGDHELYPLNGSWSPGSNVITSNQLPSLVDDSTAKTLPTGTSWQYAEHDGIWFISNGNCWLTNHPLYSAWAVGLHADVPVPKAVAIHDGRMFLGGFKHTGSFFAAGFGQKLWNVWNKNAPNTVLTQTNNVPDGRCIIWGLPGGGESQKPYTAELAALTGFNSTNVQELIIGAARRWLMGFTFIPWEGEIYSLKPLGDAIMIYGSEGIGVLEQQRDGMYKARLLLNIGIAGGQAVAGDSRKHVFVDSRGWLRTVTPGPQFSRRKYNEFLSVLIGDNPVICHDDIRHDFYIADADASFILTEDDKLAKARYKLLSCISQDDDLYATYEDTGNASMYFETGVIDLDSRIVKTLESTEIGKATLTGTSVTVYFKAKAGSTWSNDSGTAYGDAGIVDHILSALDFRFKVTQTTYDGEVIPYFNANFRVDEKMGLGEY